MRDDPMGNVIDLNVERWGVGVFNEAGLSVRVSSKGNVAFVIDETMSSPTCSGFEVKLTMEQMMRLGEVLSAAYKGDDDG